MLYDIRNEVNHCGEDINTCIQELRGMLQAVIDLCDKVVQLFGVNPLIFFEGLRRYVPILAPPVQTTLGQQSGDTSKHQQQDISMEDLQSPA